MTARTPRKQEHKEGDQETVSFAEMIGSLTGKEPPEIDLNKGQGDAFNLPEIEGKAQNPDALIEHLRDGFQGLHLHADKISAQIGALKDEIQGPRYMQVSSDGERPKVQRRRSLDDMQFALKRLTQPEPRPADDDSPQVLQDAINEVIALRMAMNKLIQASSNVYQNGLVAIRNLTAQ